MTLKSAFISPIKWCTVFWTAVALTTIALISAYVPLDKLLLSLVGIVLIAGVVLHRRGFLYLMLFLAAFEWLIFPKDGAFLYYVFEFVIVAAVVARIFFRGDVFAVPPKQLFAPIVVFVVWALFSVIFAIDVSNAAVSYIYFLASVAIYLLSYMLIDSPEAMRKVLTVQMIVSFLLIAAGLYERAVTGSRTVNLGHFNSNVIGNYAFQASAVALFTIGFLKGRVWRFAALCQLAGLFVVLYLTYSRGAMLAFLAFGTVYLASARYKKVLYLGIASACVAAAFIVTSDVFLNYFENISRSLRLTAGLTMRDDLWWSTVLLIRDYPITGVGIGCIKIVFADYVRLTDPRFVMMAHTPVLSGNVHNGFLSVLAQYGIIGFGIVIWAISATVRYLHRIKKVISDFDTRLLFSFLTATIAAVLLRSFYEATMAYGAMILSSLFVIPVAGALRLLVDRCSSDLSNTSRSGRAMPELPNEE
ncbi:MAG: O-antigen ligase family protein [Candidatus Zixiibacteriota bacterium]